MILHSDSFLLDRFTKSHFFLLFNRKNNLQADENCKEIDEEGLDPEDVLCTVRENYTRAPPLAQEDDFDDV